MLLMMLQRMVTVLSCTKSDRDPLKLFNAIADGAYGETVTCENGNRPQDWTFVPGGFTISIDDVQ